MEEGRERDTHREREGERRLKERENELGQNHNSKKNDSIICNIFNCLLNLRMHKNVSELLKWILPQKSY